MRTPFQVGLLAALWAFITITDVNAATFGEDLAFLRAHTPIIELRQPGGSAQVIVSPTWQGRVLTSGTEPTAPSLGWINRDFIASGQQSEHINVYGGEDRLWLGPEGGQFGLYFAPGVPFDLPHWSVPKPLDVLPFKLEHQEPDRVQLSSAFELVNYTGTHFSVRLERTVRILPTREAWHRLGREQIPNVSVVAYESSNTLINTGHSPWQSSTGLLSIWVLGMYPPSPRTTIVIPLRSAAARTAGSGVTSDYFGAIPPNRFTVSDHAVFLSADGRFRSKIGVAPQRARGQLGSYDPEHHILTIVQANQPPDTTEYVNSAWKMQARPYGGDSLNAYNDGPSTPGAKPLGPFYELETSSPAAALAPAARIEHTHRTIHLLGPDSALDLLARQVLGVSLAEIQTAVPINQEATSK